MSLSKYFVNSTSFKPEELIKRDDKTSSGWQALQTKEPLPFQPQQPSEASTPANDFQVSTTKPNTPVSGSTSKPANTTEINQQRISENKQSTTIPKQQPVDLEKYMELTIAKEKIAEAFHKGLQTAKDKVEQDLVDASKALFIACQQLDTVRETIINNSREELQEFALSIADKIVRISVREQDHTIIATIEEALHRAVKSDEFTVYINPDDYDTVAKRSTAMIAGLTGLNNIIIKKDTSVERGGAKIESENCTIDATIASQIDVIREEVKKNL
jgi:flagellar assembly protein FliH